MNGGRREHVRLKESIMDVYERLAVVFLIFFTVVGNILGLCFPQFITLFTFMSVYFKIFVLILLLIYDFIQH